MANCSDEQDDINDMLGDLSEDQINDLLEELDPEVCMFIAVLIRIILINLLFQPITNISIG